MPTKQKFAGAVVVLVLFGVLHESRAQVVEVATCPEQEVRLTAPDAAIGASLGRSIAIDRDTIVLGAPNDDERGPFSGSAYVFVRSGSCWAQQAKLTASDAAGSRAFGESVAINTDTIVVGAPFDDSDGQASGAVYVFVRSDGVWTEQAKLRPSDAAANKQFGNSVAIDRGTLVIGAWLDNEGGRNSGAAYVFEQRRGSWVEQTKLSAADAVEFDFFGTSVAVSGRIILVGAPNAGAAYVFTRRGRRWLEQAKLTTSDGRGQSARFGTSVDISHRTAVIGAPQDDAAVGAAYVFRITGDRSVEVATLTASDAAAEDEFGTSVAIYGRTIVVGAPFEGESNEGASYVFDRLGAAWLEQVKLVPFSIDDNFFGASVDLTSDTIVVGAPSFVHFSGTCCSGAAHVFSSRGQSTF